MNQSSLSSRLLANRLIRFILVGVTNTLVDIILFVLLRFAGLPITASNIISTSVALGLSLVLNKKYTFSGRALTRWTVVLYIGVTLVGIWILQPIIIAAITNYSGTRHLIISLAQPFDQEKLFLILLPKLAATGFTLVWNYLWYNKVVFRERRI